MIEEIKYITPRKSTAFFSVIITVIFYFINSYIHVGDFYSSLGFAFVGLVIGIVLCFAISKGKFKYNQAIFVVIYSFILALGTLTNYYSIYILPVLAIFSAILVLADMGIAIISSISVILLAIYNCNDSYYMAVVICSVILLGFYLDIEKLGNIALPIISVSLFLLLGYSVFVLNTTTEFEPGLYITLLAGFALNIVISIIVLFSYKRYYLLKYEDIYISINDPEYELLTQLKEKSPNEYKIAIHTAYLCDRISSNLSLNRTVAKCMGYYHRIGVLEEGKISENTIKLAEANGFPPALLDELRLYEKSGWKYPKSKVATVLNYSSEVIKTILLYYQNYNDKPLDYDSLIDKIFDNKYSNNICRVSDMSLQELDKMKQYLKDEKLYYDFLR